MATLRELIVKIAFKIDDAVLKKSTAKTNEILNKQKKEFQKTEESITKNKEKEAEKRIKAEQKERERQQRIGMRYLAWKDKELARRAKAEEKARQAGLKAEQEAMQAKKRAFQQTVDGLTSFQNRAIATATAIQVAFTAVAFAIIKVNDQINMGIARVQVATGKTAQASRGDFKRLLGISTGTGTDIEDVLTLYTKLGIARKQLGINEQQAFQATETIGKLSAIGGTSKSAQKGGLTQLTQAFSSDRVQAEEYNSVADALPALNQAIARNLNFQSGAQLQTFIRKGGTITGKELVGAVLKAQEEANKGFAKFPITFDRIKNKFINSFSALGLALEEQLKPANKFFQNLFNKMDFLNKFLIKNKELVGKVLVGIFTVLEKGLDMTIKLLDDLQPTFDWINTHSKELWELVKFIAIAIAGVTIAIGLMNIKLGITQGILAVMNLDPKVRVFLAIAGAVAVLEAKFGLLSKTMKLSLDLLNAFDKYGIGSSEEYNQDVPYIAGIGMPLPSKAKKPLRGLTGTEKPLNNQFNTNYGRGIFSTVPSVSNKSVQVTNNFNIQSTNPKQAGREVASIFPMALGGAMG
jgi:tape measure domain-containing protein